MKSKTNLEKKNLDYHRDRPFLLASKFSAKEHGYSGPFYRARYLAFILTSYIAQKIAKFIPVNGIRIKLHRFRGVKIGSEVMIGPDVTIDDLFPNYLFIEDGVSLAGWNIILTHSKPLYHHKDVSESFVAPVVIKKNAWLAIRTTVLPGVTIGEGAVVASGAVVTKDVPKNTIVAGIPARVIRDISNEEIRSVNEIILEETSLEKYSFWYALMIILGIYLYLVLW